MTSFLVPVAQTLNALPLRTSGRLRTNEEERVKIFRLASTMPQILVLLNRSCKGGLHNAEAKDLLSLQVVREQSWTKVSFSPEFQQGTQVQG